MLSPPLAPRTRTRDLSSSPNAPPSPAWTRVVKQFDFYYKAEEDVVQKRCAFYANY